jgi:hypothetical protein
VTKVRFFRQTVTGTPVSIPGWGFMIFQIFSDEYNNTIYHNVARTLLRLNTISEKKQQFPCLQKEKNKKKGGSGWRP